MSSSENGGLDLFEISSNADSVESWELKDSIIIFEDVSSINFS